MSESLSIILGPVQLDDAVYNVPFISPDFNKTDNGLILVEPVETIAEKPINTTCLIYACLIPICVGRSILGC